MSNLTDVAELGTSSISNPVLYGVYTEPQIKDSEVVTDLIQNDNSQTQSQPRKPSHGSASLKVCRV